MTENETSINITLTEILLKSVSVAAGTKAKACFVLFNKNNERLYFSNKNDLMQYCEERKLEPYISNSKLIFKNNKKEKYKLKIQTTPFYEKLKQNDKLIIETIVEVIKTESNNQNII